MSEPLDPTGGAVTLGDVVLRTPGLRGRATLYRDPGLAMRGAERPSPEFEAAFERQDLQAQRTVAIDNTSVAPGAGPTTMRTRRGDGIELSVPAPGEGWEQAVMATDEAGIVSWHFAKKKPDGAPLRGAGKRTYFIPRAVPKAPTDSPTRGVIGTIGKKILKVVAFKVADKALGAVGEHFARKWEESHRPHRCRTFTVDDYSSAEANELGSEDWARIGGGRGLLLVHGTFSRTHAGFGKLSREVVAELDGRYGGRVFGLDHPTLSVDPLQNAEWLAGAIPDGASVELDVLAHSRGGLVARTLAELQGELSLGSRHVRVRRAVFVATPNSGTVLSDAQHFNDLIDTYMTVFNLFPDNGVTETIEAVITVMKMIAVGVWKGLPGLGAMAPGGPFLAHLNATSAFGAEYRALASNFEPPEPGLGPWVKDFLMDAIFKQENDLVVPTVGVWGENGSAGFPIADPEILPESAGVSHSAFFANNRARERILDWLTAG